MCHSVWKGSLSLSLSLFLHKQLYVSATNMYTPEDSGSEAWWVYMVSCVCSNDQQVCTIVSAYSVLMGVHNHIRHDVFLQISVWVHACWNHILLPICPDSHHQRHMITACNADTKSVNVLVSYSSLIKMVPNTFSCLCECCLRFSFGHSGRTGNDSHMLSGHHSCNAFGYVHFWVLISGNIQTSIPGRIVWIKAPKFSYDTSDGCTCRHTICQALWAVSIHAQKLS